MGDHKYRGPFSEGGSASAWLAIIILGGIIAVILAPRLGDRQAQAARNLQEGLAKSYREYRLNAFASDELPEFRPETSEEWTVFCKNWTEETGCDMLAKVGYPFSSTEVEKQCKLEQEDINDGPERRLLYSEGLRGAWRQFDYSLKPATVCSAYGFDLSG
ncbi:hypothetical protein INR77_08435 [Erythrobacter sp. SCSIO 43205]|uniref:hypothetical protein n=1 Tax=Erythrobacter sp. SCSIO 43205 TaxID=2779361 RepID=UPI001CA83C4E|nr:hypothetical protein [Erythrobacter sp. SCSIO 43205]UAB76881.1 hypothetical protein INR77_08435 [Erythrobacter sp. SCSIO 43205]